jgi:WD40 repeat protein/serine/threonine protein kinase
MTDPSSPQDIPPDQPAPQTEVQLPSALAQSQELSVPQEATQHPGAPRLAGYILVSPLGRGAYAQVWKAWQMRTRKWVALKIFLERGGVNWLFLQREVERLVRLDKHPHIVSLLDADLSGETPYYAMDYMEKGSLERFARPGQGEPPEDAARWMREIAEALSYVHSKGLIHCDLKPANILLDEEGHVRVADFGQSRILSESSGALGTLFYMAPEQATILKDGEQLQPDVRWDIYGLGTTAYSILMGKVPFEERDHSALERAGSLEARLQLYRELLARTPLDAFAELRARKVDQDLAAIVAKCARAAPSLRYGTAAETLADLRARAELRPVSGLAERRLYRLERFLRRNAAAVTVAAAALACLVWAASQIMSKQVELSRQLAASLVLRARHSISQGDDGAAALLYAESNRVRPSLVARANAMAYLELLPRPRRVFHTDLYGTVSSVSPDGKRALFQTELNAGVWVIDLATGRTMAALYGLAGPPLAWSPDGRLVAGTCYRSDAATPSVPRIAVCIWDAMSGEPFGAEIANEDGSDVRFQFTFLQFSADGKRLLTATLRTIRVWDVATGELVGKPIVFHDPLPQDMWATFGPVALSPDGKKVLTGGSWEGVGRIWDVATGWPVGAPLAHAQEGRMDSAMARVSARNKEMMRARMAQVMSQVFAAVNAVQQGLASARKSSSPAPGAGAQGGGEQPTAASPPSIGETGSQSPFSAVAFSSDGKWVYAGDDFGRVWDANTGLPVSPPMRHRSGVGLAVFHPDKASLAAAYADGTVQVWRLPDGQSVDRIIAQGQFSGPGQGIKAMAFSSDGVRLLVASSDGTAQLWNSWTGEPLSLPMHHEKAVTAAAIAPDGSVTTASEDGNLRVWKTASLDPPYEVLVASVSFSAAALSRDGRVLLAVSEKVVPMQFSEGKTVQLWNLSRAAAAGAAMVHPFQVRRVALSPDGKRALTISLPDKTARLWDPLTGRLAGNPLVHNELINAEAFSPDSRIVATGSLVKKTPWAVRGLVSFWDAATGQPRGQPLEPKGGVSSLAFSPDGERLVVGTWDGAAFLYDVRSGRSLGQELRHKSLSNIGITVNAVAFSPDGRRVVTASNDKTARLWDGRSGVPVGEPMRHEDAVLAVAFSPDGRLVATAGQDKTVRLWDAATGKARGAALRHEGPVNTVGFSPDGRVLLTSGNIGTRLWDVRSGEAFGKPLRHALSVAPVFLPDGRSLLTAGFGLRRWSLDWLNQERSPQTLARALQRATLRKLDAQGDIAPLAWDELRDGGREAPRLAAAVNGTKILRKDFEAELKEAQDAVYRSNTAAYMSFAFQKDLRKRTLEKMITDELLYQEARKSKVAATEAEVLARIDDWKKLFSRDPSGRELTAAEAEERFRDNLSAQGQDLAGLRRRVQRSLTIKKIWGLSFKDLGTKPDEKEVRAYYDALRAYARGDLNALPKDLNVAAAAAFKDDAAKIKAAGDEQVRMSWIVFKLRFGSAPAERSAILSKVMSVVKRLKAGEKFSDLARRESEHPETAAKGGDLGYTTREEMKRLPPQFGPVFDIPVGGGGSFILPDGIAIVAVTERCDAQNLPFNRYKAGIEAYLQDLRAKEALAAYSRTLEVRGDVVRYPAPDPGPEAIELEDL